MRTLVRNLVACLVLTPAVASASSIKITTDPPGASVQLDGTAYGPSPVTIPKVDPGTHELKVSAEGYVTRVDLLQVSGGEDVQVHAPLNPAPKIVEPPPRPAAPPPAPAPAPAAQPAAGYAPPPAPAAQPAPTYGAQVAPPPTGYAQPAPAAPAVQTPPPPPSAYATPPSPPATAYGAQPQPAAQPQAIQPPPPVPPAPLPVSQLPTRWGTQKKTCTLRVDTTPTNAIVQVVGMPMAKPAPAVFSGFAPGTITLQVTAPGYKDKKVAVDINGDARTHVVLEPIQ